MYLKKIRNTSDVNKFNYAINKKDAGFVKQKRSKHIWLTPIPSLTKYQEKENQD